MSGIERKRQKMTKRVKCEEVELNVGYENKNKEDEVFDEWNEVKKNTNKAGRMPRVKEGEVWWCAMGKNVGVEINGKSGAFSRPVLVLKKLSRFGFMGIPLTSQLHEGEWYVPFTFQMRCEIAVLAQARVMSVARLYRKIGDVTKGDMIRIKTGFGKLYLGLECGTEIKMVN